MTIITNTAQYPMTITIQLTDWGYFISTVSSNNGYYLSESEINTITDRIKSLIAGELDFIYLPAPVVFEDLRSKPVNNETSL